MKVEVHRVSADGREGALVDVAFVDGRVGRGEASPLPGYSPDTLDDCIQALVTAPHAIPERLPAARYALELAALPATPGDGAPIARAVLVDDFAGARAAAGDGFPAVKLKIARGPWPDELALIARIRRELPALAVRVDANARWSVAEARPRLRELADLDVEFVEQPVPPEQLVALRGAPVTLAADESLHDPRADLDIVFAVARVAVLKPMVLGGLRRCVAIAARAREHGCDAIVSHLMDGSVAMRGYEALARMLPATRPHGLGPHPGLSRW